jgi:CubicO group peptidase (beta-lactamase class C family)
MHRNGFCQRDEAVHTSLLSINRNNQISSMLLDRIAEGDFPSAVYVVGAGGEPIFGEALGVAVSQPKIDASLDTIYDLASLTKPLVTGLLLAQRVERRAIKLEDRAARYLGEFDRAGKREITIRHLLTHTSGLPAWKPLYALTHGDLDQVVNTLSLQPLESEPGTSVVYSDLGFIALGILLERLEGASLEELARSELFEPLGLRQTYFNPPAAIRDSIAASETGNEYEREMCGDEANDFHGWRKNLIWGEVHDGNAYFLGGAAGHAGLFSNALETLRLANQFIEERTELLAPRSCELFRTNMTPAMDEARSFAWQLAATPDSTASTSLASDSFGHLGFTGTSCWVDPSKSHVLILLTNRTHAHTLPFTNINSTRREFHRLAEKSMQTN